MTTPQETVYPILKTKFKREPWRKYTLPVQKKAVLLAAMVKSALARTINGIIIMIIKKVGKIHRAGKIKLDEYL